MKDLPDPSKPLRRIRHERFIQNLLTGQNQTKAYANAGYKGGKNANVHSGGLLKKGSISARLRFLQEKAAEGKVLTKRRALEILSEIAETNMSDLLTVGLDGVTFVDYGKNTTNKSALKKAKTRTVRDEHGNTIMETMFNEVELESKIPAIERISKMLGWDTPEKVEAGDNLTALLKNIATGDGGYTRAKPTKNGLHKR